MVKSLNFRVYRRTQDNIALLWNKHALDADQTVHIEAFEVKNGNSRKLTFMTTHDMEAVVEEGLIAPDDTEMMVISHEKNNINAYEDCSIQICFGTAPNQKTHDILVYGFGVLPPFEKDDRKLNNHIYGFYEAERKWVKLPVVRCKDGTFAVPVKLIKD